jgi:hypothetical protein
MGSADTLRVEEKELLLAADGNRTSVFRNVDDVSSKLETTHLKRKKLKNGLSYVHLGNRLDLFFKSIRL